jgi:hypothetical protein
MTLTPVLIAPGGAILPTPTDESSYYDDDAAKLIAVFEAYASKLRDEEEGYPWD